MRIAGTGHRPEKLGGWTPGNPTERRVREALKSLLLDLRVKHVQRAWPLPMTVLSGMALGFDTWWAQSAELLDIAFEAYVPFKRQYLPWNERDQAVYQHLLEVAAEKHILSDAPYNARLMQRRNEVMVDSCDVLVACWDGSFGGTANCIEYARKKHVPIIYLDAREL